MPTVHVWSTCTNCTLQSKAPWTITFPSTPGCTALTTGLEIQFFNLSCCTLHVGEDFLSHNNIISHLQSQVVSNTVMPHAPWTAQEQTHTVLFQRFNSLFGKRFSCATSSPVKIPFVEGSIRRDLLQVILLKWDVLL